MLAFQHHAGTNRPLLHRVAVSAEPNGAGIRDSRRSIPSALEPPWEDIVVKRRILIADDEARVLLILHESLKKLGNEYEITTAHNGQEALALALADRFDLVITDLRMPGMGGIELAEAIQASEPDTKFIWITAYGCHNVAEECLRLGILTCLDKPLEIREIRRTVKLALGRLEKEERNGSNSAKSNHQGRVR